jgi:hypothetical protein
MKLNNCRQIFLEKFVLNKQLSILVDNIREEKKRLNLD